MPLPALTTMAAAASLVTCVRSSWEMTRMVRAKKRLNQEERKAVRVLEDLEDLLDDGVLDEDQFNNFCDQLEFAMRERDSESSPPSLYEIPNKMKPSHRGSKASKSDGDSPEKDRLYTIPRQQFG